MRLSPLLLLLVSAAILASPALHAGQCRPGHVLLQVLGSGGPELDDGRASSAYLIWVNGHARLLIDSGAGAALNYERAGARLEDLRAILFTHLHVDHSVDFPAFIKAAFFSSRDTDLPVFGPAGNALMPATSTFVQDLLGDAGAYRYLSEYVNPAERADFHLISNDVALRPRAIQRYPLGGDLSVSAIPVHHGPVAAVAWRVDVAGCTLTFSGDMSNRYATLATLAADSDLLVAHNAVPQGASGVARRLHMPPDQIGRIAASASVGALVLSHRMKRTQGNEAQTLSALRDHYRGPMAFADDMDCFEPADGSRVPAGNCPSLSR